MIRILMAGPHNLYGNGVTQHTVNLVDQLLESGVKVNWYKFCGSNLQKIYQRTIGLFIESIKKQHEYDIIHVQCSAGIGSFPAAVTGAFVSILLKKRFIFTYHNSKIRRNILFKFCLKHADRIILVSQLQKDLIGQEYPEYISKAVSIPNGFNNRIFYSQDQNICKEQIKIPKEIKVILTVGNLLEVKGHRYFIDAIGKITSTKKDIMGVIVGSGPLEQTLHNQIHRLDLEKNILLTGGKPHSEISIWMNACDVFILPSLNEGNPTVMFEALGCGKPVVGTRVGGVPEVITTVEFGLLVEPANPKDLAEKILIALNRKWNREAIIEFAEQFTWENISKEIVGVYKQVLQ